MSWGAHISFNGLQCVVKPNEVIICVFFYSSFFIFFLFSVHSERSSSCFLLLLFVFYSFLFLVNETGHEHPFNYLLLNNISDGMSQKWLRLKYTLLMVLAELYEYLFFCLAYAFILEPHRYGGYYSFIDSAWPQTQRQDVRSSYALSTVDWSRLQSSHEVKQERVRKKTENKQRNGKRKRRKKKKKIKRQTKMMRRRKINEVVGGDPRTLAEQEVAMKWRKNICKLN